MTNVTRKLIFEQAAKKLRQDFAELMTVPHRGLKGGEAEQLIKAFLKAHLPRRFDVGAGFIIDHSDNISKQTDVIIYDAINCPVYRASENAAIFPSNNVAAVVGVKSVLDKAQLALAFENIKAAKALAKAQTPGPLQQTLGCLFAFDSAISLNTLASHYHEMLFERGFGHHIDIIAVLDRGIITMATSSPDASQWGIAVIEGFGGLESEGWHIGLAIQKLDLDTLDVFLRFILAKLSLFNGIIDHPGFRWSLTATQGMMAIRYLSSICHERDPATKRRRLEEYKEIVRTYFNNHPMPVPDV